MSARDEILASLRQSLSRPDLPFPPHQTTPLTPATRMTVTEAGGTKLELAHRFGEELIKLHGSYDVMETATEARLALVNRVKDWLSEEEATRKGAVIATGQERSVLAWAPEALPVDGVDIALDASGITLVAPNQLQKAETRDQVRHIRVGISGVEAAFASTGSMLVVSGAQTSRAASLLPFRHLALIPFSRLYPTIEAWLAEHETEDDLVDYVRSHANLAMITGPSKSADIEMNLTLGVHGPKFVHVILFDDI